MNRLLEAVGHGLYLLVCGPFILLAMAYCKITGRKKI